jgi:hypothetical protein
MSGRAGTLETGEPVQDLLSLDLATVLAGGPGAADAGTGAPPPPALVLSGHAASLTPY